MLRRACKKVESTKLPGIYKKMVIKQRNRELRKKGKSKQGLRNWKNKERKMNKTRRLRSIKTI